MDEQQAEVEVMPPEKKKKAAVRQNGKQGSEETAISRYEPAYLLSQAIDKGLDIATLERLMDLQERWEKNKAKAEFFEALARFQSRVPKITKKKKGYGYLYAPLGEIDSQIKGAMENCGLSKRWIIDESIPDQVRVSCVVTHVAGHNESSSIGPVGWDLLEKTERMNGLQHRAAVIQYLQRYTCIAALGLTTADDDVDGVSPEEARKQKAEHAPITQPKARPGIKKLAVERAHLQPAAASEEIEASTIKLLTSKMEHAALANGDFKKRFGLEGIEQVKRTDLNTVLGWIIDPQNA